MAPRKKKNRGNRNGKGKQAAKKTNQQQSPSPIWNFVREAGPGCHIARPEYSINDGARKHQQQNDNDWVLEWEPVDPSDYVNDEADDDDDEIPDLAIDPDEQTLTLCNIKAEPVVAYITVHSDIGTSKSTTLIGKDGRPLEAGSTTDKEGRSNRCTTLIVLCPPHTFCHLCYIDMSMPPPLNLQDLSIESDVQVWNQHRQVEDFHSQSVGFPLQVSSLSSLSDNQEATQQQAGFLCTQGQGGHLTHFFSGNQHAIDFQCPKGTPLLAVGNGVVVESSSEQKYLTGIAVSNLFSWNAILLRLDPPTTTKEEDSANGPKSDNDAENSNPLFVEYVHIATSCVKVGDRVTEGQVIGTSGGIGFSPEDHLHFAAYRSSEPHAPTVGFAFRKASLQEETFIPTAGKWYNGNGEIPPPR